MQALGRRFRPMYRDIQRTDDEVLDATFNSTGNKLATASADGLARVYNVFTGACTALLQGHDNEISKI